MPTLIDADEAIRTLRESAASISFLGPRGGFRSEAYATQTAICNCIMVLCEMAGHTMVASENEVYHVPQEVCSRCGKQENIMAILERMRGQINEGEDAHA